MITLPPRELALLAINGFEAMQKIDELEALLTIVDSLQPKIILEIGVGKGGTAWCWSKFSTVEQLILIDLPGGPWGGGPTKESISYIASNSQAHLHFIAGNSANSECVNAVERSLDGELVDLLVLDGDHSYYGVKTDFKTYEPFVRPGGLIALHDICEHPVETKCEVKKFADELMQTWPKEQYSEFIAEPTNWGGILCLKK